MSSKCAGLFNATVHAKFGGAINEDSDEACECLLAMPLKVRVARRSIPHPHGGQFDSVWPPARTPHVGPQYVW